jgi:hypothetical protein
VAEEQVTPGAEDKRCLLRLDELSVCFKLQRDESSTLGETLMTAWGGAGLDVPNREANRLKATDYNIAVVGDTQPRVLRRLLDSRKGSEAWSGWMNRYLWAVVHSPRSLPLGGDVGVLSPFVAPLAEALASVKQAGRLALDAEAEAHWRGVYPSLKVSGDSIPHTERAAPQTLRLAIIYALADKSGVIRLPHLQAALAVWDYCRESARLLFGDTGGSPEALPLPQQLLNAIAANPGSNLTQLHQATGKRYTAEARQGALAWLKTNGLAHPRPCRLPQGGPPAECWWPGPSADRTPQTADRTPPAEADGLRNAECGVRGEGPGPDGLPPAECGVPVPEAAPTPVPPAECGVRGAEGLTLAELFDRLRAVGGVLERWPDEPGVVSVKAPAGSVTPEMERAVADHQEQLLLLVPMPTPEEAEARFIAELEELKR